MNTITKCLENQSGSATLVALLVLCLITIMGMSGARTASVEMEIAGNDHLNKLAFYSAEASRAYVMMHPQIYGVANIDPDPNTPPHYFPNDTDPYVADTVGSATPYDLGNNQSFRGSVKYLRPTSPPRGSGYDTSSFQAHQYQMTCQGQGPRETSKTITAGFYRIGL
ncbi:MAG: pilus assembly PilX N-terminal domain-containing protein [Desulfosarcinaceae bacterium]|jgi:hypothetical protein